ncbi:MAG: hypothetical protein B6I20_01820 [Bacteroidetes bacterium 4572_117]|nr:MAG: hypothetical protein B6I20_01820 [Bacteroidetes bacterium 4572_117]
MLCMNKNIKIFTLLLLVVNLHITTVAQVKFTSSNIPIIIITTNEKEILDEPRIVADMGIIDNGNERNYVTDPYNGYSGKINIEIRGSTSQSYPKKQYGFETQNIDGSNNNVSLLGLPVENDWILYAPYSDKSLIRNILAYKLSESLGNYAPRTKLCELVLNGEYLGVYVLIEKIKRDKNRVDISKLKPNEIDGDDLTGGYIIKIDKSTGHSCYGWNTTIANVYLQYEYPDCDKIVPEQKTYIQKYVNNFEESLFSDYFTDPINGYRKFADINSLIDYFIVNETSKNVDAYRLSTFFYKDKGRKIQFGPVWDYNLAFGNANYNNAYKTSGLIAPQHIWWNRLLEDSTFNNTLKSRWCEIRKEQLSNQKVLNLIDSLSEILQESQHRNFQKWDILGKQIWPNFFVGSAFKDEINFLKSWSINRLNWLDNNLPGNYEDNIPFIEFKARIFPNPFDYFFTFAFSLESASNVSLLLFDTQGRLITKIIDSGYYKSGNHSIVWNSFIGNNILPNGFYIIMIELNNKIVFQEKIIKNF